MDRLLVDDWQGSRVSHAHGTDIRIGTLLVRIIAARTKHFSKSRELSMDLEAYSWAVFVHEAMIHGTVHNFYNHQCLSLNRKFLQKHHPTLGMFTPPSML
jgi:hypothetical protein